ncbi:hypothetical protein DB347_00935 [Opitutaceae bacterium EW11]|nr:hypothetical protein DB347_00935 [Opitutaceae bacterium EW11]
MSIPAASTVVAATLQREWLSQRLNRFFYWHVGLLVICGLSTLIAPPEAAARGAAWWILQVVLFAISMSSLLLGLSSSHAELDEMSLLQTHPVSNRSWTTGKALGLLLITFPTALLLVLPAALSQGPAWLLVGVAAAAGGVSGVFSLLGLALGAWIRDPVRGLISAVALWLGLLVGTDLLLLLTAGSEFVQSHPRVWVLPLMLNPLDAFRITVLFTVEHAAFTGLQAGGLTEWWLHHGGVWLTSCLAAWAILAWLIATAGTARRPDA